MVEQYLKLNYRKQILCHYAGRKETIMPVFLVIAVAFGIGSAEIGEACKGESELFNDVTPIVCPVKHEYNFND